MIKSYLRRTGEYNKQSKEKKVMLGSWASSRGNWNWILKLSRIILGREDRDIGSEMTRQVEGACST
jgi:hypothetical protein